MRGHATLRTSCSSGRASTGGLQNTGLCLVLLAFAIGHAPAVASTIIAADNASNSQYSGGTFIGADGGTGFGNWTSAPQGAGGSYVGSTGLGSSSFGIYAGGGSGNAFTAYRPFDTALAVNDTFSVQFQPTSINAGGSVGVSLFAGGVERGTFYFNGGASNWGWNGGAGGSNTNQGFSGAVTLALTRTGTNSYSLALTQNSATQTITGTFTAAGNPVSSAINEVGFFSSAQGGSQNFGFNNLQVVAVPEPSVSVLAGACLLALGSCMARRIPRA